MSFYNRPTTIHRCFVIHKSGHLAYIYVSLWLVEDLYVDLQLSVEIIGRIYREPVSIKSSNCDRDSIL